MVWWRWNARHPNPALCKDNVLHAVTNQPQLSEITYFYTDRLKMESSLLEMFLGFAYELSSVAWLHLHTSVEQKLYLHFRRWEKFPSVISDVLQWPWPSFVWLSQGCHRTGWFDPPTTTDPSELHLGEAHILFYFLIFSKYRCVGKKIYWFRKSANSAPKLDV